MPKKLNKIPCQHLQLPNEENFVCGYYNLFHDMSQGVVFLAADGTVIDVNPAAEILFGLSSIEMKNRALTDLHGDVVHEDGSQIKEEMNPFLTALKTGQTVPSVVMGIHQLNHEVFRWIKIQMIPQFHPGKKKLFKP